MNITVNDLRRIIAEEIQSELNERVGLLTDEEILDGLRSYGKDGWWTVEKIREKLLPIEDSRSHGWRKSMRTAMDGLGMRRTYNR